LKIIFIELNCILVCSCITTRSGTGTTLEATASRAW